MAVESTLQTVSIQAGADLSASQFCFVNVNSSGQLALAGVDADIVGVLQDKPNAAGHAGSVAFAGRSKMLANGTIAAGGRVTSDANGKAIAVASGSAVSAGVALTAGSAGQIIDILIQIAGAQFSALPN